MATFDITQLQSLEHDTLNGNYNSLVFIDDTHFILAYAGNDFKGVIKTFSIDGSYNITEIDSLQHDATQNTTGYFNSLVMIDSTHFALAYAGSGDDGFIKTFSIDGSYDNITQIDSLEHDTTLGQHNSLVMIDSTHLILAYTGVDVGASGHIKTFSIDGSADNITQIDDLVHDNATFNSLVMIDSTHFALAYAGSGDDGFIKTFSIDGSYDNITSIDSIEHDTGNGDHNSLIKIDSTHFALAYNSVGNDAHVKTFSIDGSYDNITQIAILEHDTDLGKENSLVLIDSTHLALAYAGSGSDGFIKTFSFDGSYENITQIDSLEHDTDASLQNSLVQIDTNHYILAYAGSAGLDGFIKTFEIDAETPVSSFLAQIIMG